MELIRYLFVALICVIVTSSCEKNDWSKEVPLTVKLKSDAEESFVVYGSSFECEDAKLTITSIVIHGERLQAENVDFTYSEKIELDLLSDSKVNHQIKLPIGTYEKLSAKIYFDMNSSSPLIEGEISHPGQGPNPYSQQFSLPVTFSESEIIKIKNESENDVVLIEEETSIFEISIGLKKSLKEISAPQWNGLMTANENQNQIDLNTEVGNNFKSKVNEGFLANIKLKITN